MLTGQEGCYTEGSAELVNFGLNPISLGELVNPSSLQRSQVLVHTLEMPEAVRAGESASSRAVWDTQTESI